MSNFNSQSPGSAELFGGYSVPAGHSLSAIRRITNETPAGFGARDDSFFRRATGPVDDRRGCPANSGYPQSL
jgi:hypothetical protein